MKIEDLKDKQVAIWGMGVEGQAVLDFLKKHFPNKDVFEIENNHIPSNVDVVFKSPGVSSYLPEIAEARQKGIEISTLINLYLANKQPRAKVIAVTGTKGKSTTVSILNFMLEKLGYRVGLGGNIGSSPLDFVEEDLDYVVLELSSFQIKDMAYDVDVALFVNLSQAHLDWHLNEQNYVADKLLLSKHAKESIINSQDKNLRTLTDVKFYNDKEVFHVENGKIFDGETLIEIPKWNLSGEHNLLNLCGVFSVLKTLGLDYKKALPALADFQPLEHRLQKGYEKNGLVFVNDSISTVADSTIAGLESFKDEGVVLIAGGHDNGSADYKELNDYIEKHAHVKKVVCLPDTGKFIGTSKSVSASDMRAAVTEALKGFEKGVVLLSPAAPSFNLYKNYKERGKDFLRIAKELME